MDFLAAIHPPIQFIGTTLAISQAAPKIKASPRASLISCSPVVSLRYGL
jgi:hypothetical protein